MENLNGFYTYAYLRVDRTPYYVGKGKGKRLYKKGKGEVNPPKDKSRIIFLKQNLTEEEAFKHEKYMISVLGRKDLKTGILRNKTNGGDGPSGMIMSIEARLKLSKSKKGKKPNLTEEHRKELRNRAYRTNDFGTYRRTEIHLNRLKECNKLYVYELTSPNGEKIIIDNMNEFCIKNSQYKLDRSAMNRVARGEQTNHKGWTVVIINYLK